MECDGCVVGLIATRGAGWLAVKVWMFLGGPPFHLFSPTGRNSTGVTLFAIGMGWRIGKGAASQNFGSSSSSSSSSGSGSGCRSSAMLCRTVLGGGRTIQMVGRS